MGNSNSKSKLRARLATSEADNVALKKQLEQQRSAASLLSSTTCYSGIDYSQPVMFSSPSHKHPGCTQRVQFEPWRGEMRVDIREWFGDGRTQRGVSLPVADASRLAQILSDVVVQAEYARVRQRLD